MKNKYIIPFVNTTKEVFKEFLNLDVVYSNPELFEKNEKDIKWEVSGLIGLAGDVKGILAIVFEKELVLESASRLLEKEIKDIDNDVMDVVGELVNIIAGNAKKFLDEYKIFISLPSVIKGKIHSFFPSSSHVATIKIPFKSELGNFNLLIYIEQ